MHLFEEKASEFRDLRDRMRDFTQRVHSSDHPLAQQGWRSPDKSVAIGLFAEIHAHNYLEIQFMKRAIAALEPELEAQPYYNFDDAWQPSSRQQTKPRRSRWAAQAIINHHSGSGECRTLELVVTRRLFDQPRFFDQPLGKTLTPGS